MVGPKDRPVNGVSVFEMIVLGSSRYYILQAFETKFVKKYIIYVCISHTRYRTRVVIVEGTKDYE